MLRTAGLHVGERVVAHSDGPGRVVFEREADVLSEPSGAPTGRYDPAELDALRRMGPTVVDAGVIIGFLDADDAHDAAADAELREARSRNDSMVLPASALAQVLVGAWRAEPSAVATVQQPVDHLPIGIQPLDMEIAHAAAELRARHRSLKPPDAMVIATASHLDADHLLTTDHRWPSRSKLRLSLNPPTRW